MGGSLVGREGRPSSVPAGPRWRTILSRAARGSARGAFGLVHRARCWAAGSSPPTDLRKQVGWLERVLSGLEEGIVVADARGRLRPANPAALRILGSAVSDSPSGHWTPEGTLCGPDGVTPLTDDRQPLLRALHGEDVESEEHLLRRSAGSEGIWVGVSARPLRDDSRRTVGALLVLRDLTDRRRSEADLVRLSSAVAQTADAVLIADRQGCVLYVNPSFEAMTGVPRTTALERSPHALLTELHEPGVYDGIRATILRGVPFRGTVLHRRKDGRAYHADETATPVKDALGRLTHVVYVARDATDRRRSEEREFSMRLAGQVQQRLYPARAPKVEGLDLAGSVVPAEETCGDCYDYLEAPDGTVAIVVGDVSGHGFGPALIMAQARAYLRAVASTPSTPWEVLGRVNRHLCRDLPEDQFVTLILVAVDPKTRHLTYASAGHVAGLLVDRYGALKARLPANGPPLGVFADAEYPATEPVPTEPGDTLILVTDGVMECRSITGREFEEEGVLEVAAARAGEPAEEVVSALHGVLRRYAAGTAPRDDRTVVVCRWTPLAAVPTASESTAPATNGEVAPPAAS